MLKVKGNYKSNQNHKVLQGIEWEETKKNANGAHCQKARTGSRMNSARAVNSAAGTKFCRFHFLLFFSILSSWFLIYNAEFDSNSSCLDRLNNFGTISSQKLQN